MSKQKGHLIGWLMLKYDNGRIWYVINDETVSGPVPAELFGYQLVDGRKIIVEHNFKTDFATIPRIFWLLAPPVGYGARAAYGKAAVVHDYLYKSKAIEGKPIPRTVADNIFLECMEFCKVHPFRRYMMWGAVRLFGWIFWRSNNI